MGVFVFEQATVRVGVAVAFVVAAAVVLVRVLPRSGSSGTDDPCTGGDHESASAHVLMCAVMSVMVLFPAQLHAHALHGVLLAMTLVFGLLAAARLVRERALRPGRAGGLGYHLVAAGVMLVTMSGHSTAGHGSAPASVPMAVLALIFLVDAAAVSVCALRGGRLWWVDHPVARGPHALPAVLPHLVMDLGMAYMSAAAAFG